MKLKPRHYLFAGSVFLAVFIAIWVWHDFRAAKVADTARAILDQLGGP